MDEKATEPVVTLAEFAVATRHLQPAVMPAAAIAAEQWPAADSAVAQ
jgi:hypothetical protein